MCIRDSPSTLTRTVSFEINDGDLSSNVLNRDIEITAVNDAPVLSAIETAPASYTEMMRLWLLLAALLSLISMTPI